MDSRRPPYLNPPAAQPHHPHPPHPHQPPTPVEHRPPHPTYSQAQQPPQAHPPPPQAHPYHHPAPPQQQQYPQQQQQHPGPALPPIQPPYAGAGAPQTQQSLPSFHHPAPPPVSHEPREGPPEYHSYNAHHQHARSEHATPAPVNRSFSHDSHQQRTPTTPAQPGQYTPGSAPDGMHPHSQPHPMEHAHHGYPPPQTNGVPHGLPPPQQPQYQHPPPPHEQYTPTMENHHPYGPPPPSQGMYAPQSYGPASTQVRPGDMKRKHMRATQACEQCRQRKQKCDEGQPCSFCKENNLTCQYRDTPPAKTDKNMEKLLQYMESHTASLSNLTTKMEDMDRRVRRMEQTNSNGAQPVPPTAGTDAEPMDGVIQQRSELDDHRTAPHKLILLWPSVWPLLQDAGINVNNTYVMEAEDRGILRIWTRGEGIDEHDGTQPGGPASPARSEESGEGSSAATPPDGLWGTGFPQTPVSEIKRSEPYSVGGLKPDGSLDLDVHTINALYDSYMRHIHIMHPFLDKQRLRKLFDHFIKRYCTGHPNLKQKFAVGSGSDSERPLKRQRSNGSTANTVVGYELNGMRKEPTERSPGNAIVWLVLAMGKICLHKDPLPGPVQDNRLNANAVVSHQISGPTITGSSPISTNIKPSPMSPQSTPTTQPTPSGADGMVRVESRSRRSSFDAVQTAGARNLDVIPGLAYYAKAAEILGDQGDGNDLVHAQMFLLAGLYKGQLARVKESMSWISMAGRAVLNLLDRYKLYNDNYWTSHGDIRKQHEAGRLRIKDKRHNLIVLASWTCLQLESDILAELRLPSSNIKSVENMLLMPHNMPENEQENYEGLEATSIQEQSEETQQYNRMLMYYSSQMFLRKRLNQVHQEMYGDLCLSQTLAQVREMLSGHERILGYWRETLPIGLKWDDTMSPPADILDARLRAKYWGARYIINRPFLDYALHIMPHTKDGRSIESVAVDSQGNPRDKAEIHLFKAIELMGEEEIWQASKRCVDAAMQSTVAFDSVPDRLILTNIHGTAHAQFGNMLVLSATHYNKWLKALVPEEKFHGLLERTIRFLRRHAAISPTCAHDCSILEKITSLLFGVSPDAKHIYHNEGVVERVPTEPHSANSSFGPGT